MAPAAYSVVLCNPPRLNEKAVHTDMPASQRFWDFSVALYSAEGVANTCIELQDHHGVDVNMLLLCIWRGLNDQGPLTPDAMNSLAAVAYHWQREVIAPLRAVRRKLKSQLGQIGQDANQLYSKALEFELACERAEQLMLVRKLDIPETELTDGAMTASHATVIAQNVASYLTSQSTRLTSAEYVPLRTVFDAAGRDMGGAIFAEFERLSAAQTGGS